MYKRLSKCVVKKINIFINSRRQHEPHCENCWIKFKSFAEVYKVRKYMLRWKINFSVFLSPISVLDEKLIQHQPYCAYKTDCIRVRPLSESSRPSAKISKKRLKETCEFCDEKFDKEEINEHINSCTKRVSSAKWVLKYRKSKIKTHES